MTRYLRYPTLFLWLIALALAVPLPAQNPTNPENPTARKPERNPTAKVRFDPGNKRDPFINLLALRRRAEEDSQVVESTLRPPGIAGMRVGEVSFTGTSRRQDGILAVVRGNDRRTYFLREGDRLFDGVVKRIESESIHFVQETKLRSGKITTQEVSKRLRAN